MLWLLLVAGAVTGVLAALYLIGTSLPQDHVASRTVRLGQKPEAVWAVLRDQASMPLWRPEVVKVERVADVNGHETWRETWNNGWSMVMETVEADEPRRLVGRLHDPGKRFGGTWTYELTPRAEGCLLTITERGEVYSAFMKVLTRLMDPRKSLTRYLTALARKFGESPAFE